jgi:hypothetical protein
MYAHHIQQGGILTELSALEAACICAALKQAAGSAVQLYELVQVLKEKQLP